MELVLTDVDLQLSLVPIISALRDRAACLRYKYCHGSYSASACEYTYRGICIVVYSQAPCMDATAAV